MKKVILMVIALAMMLVCAGCGSNDEKADSSSTQFIVVAYESMNMEEISQEIGDALKSVDQQAVVEEVKVSEENKYLVTIRSQLTEDEVVSLLKEEDWIQRAEINFELKMY